MTTSTPIYSDHHVRASWALHTLTASGVIVGMIGLHSIIEGYPRAAILWLLGAMVLDGVDGPIARKLNIKEVVPTLDGDRLDLIIDYFTCAIVPVAFLDKFKVLPDNTIAPTGFAILLVSALWMARADHETPDRWFRGFPAEWNMVIPTLYLIGANRWFNLIICLVLCGLTISRVQFPHPLSVRSQRPITLGFLALWLGSTLWLTIAEHPVPPVRIVLILSPAWMVWQVADRGRWLAAHRTEREACTEPGNGAI